MRCSVEQFRAKTLVTVDNGWGYDTDAVCLVKDGDEYHVFTYSGCSCPGFTSMIGAVFVEEGPLGLIFDFTPDWSGSRADLLVMASAAHDVHMPFRIMKPEDCDYALMRDFWAEVQRLDAEGSL